MIQLTFPQVRAARAALHPPSGLASYGDASHAHDPEVALDSHAAVSAPLSSAASIASEVSASTAEVAGADEEHANGIAAEAAAATATMTRRVGRARIMLVDQRYGSLCTVRHIESADGRFIVWWIRQ